MMTVMAVIIAISRTIAASSPVVEPIETEDNADDFLTEDGIDSIVTEG